MYIHSLYISHTWYVIYICRLSMEHTEAGGRLPRPLTNDTSVHIEASRTSNAPRILSPRHKAQFIYDTPSSFVSHFPFSFQASQKGPLRDLGPGLLGGAREIGRSYINLSDCVSQSEVIVIEVVTQALCTYGVVMHDSCSSSPFFSFGDLSASPGLLSNKVG